MADPVNPAFKDRDTPVDQAARDAAAFPLDPKAPIFREKDVKLSRYSNFGSGVLRAGGPAGDGTQVVILRDHNFPLDRNRFVVVRADEFAERYKPFAVPQKPPPLREDATPAERIAYDQQVADYEAADSVAKRWAADDAIAAHRTARGPAPVLPANPTPAQQAAYDEAYKKWNAPAPAVTAAQKAAADKAAADKVEADRLAAGKAEADRVMRK